MEQRTSPVVTLRTNVSAVVKWFNPNLGFGFVITQDGDVFLHINMVSISPVDTDQILPQAQLLVDVGQGQKGLQVSQVHRLVKAGIRREGARDRRGYPTRVNDGHTIIGTVKFFNNERGFGFITTKEGGDVYVDRKTIDRAGIHTLRPDQRVRFTQVSKSRGVTANDVRLVDE